jgi:hypothetical protein
MSLMLAVDLTFGCTGAREDIDTRAYFCQVMQGETLTRFGDDDDEQIVQCLQHVKKILDFTLAFCMSDFVIR